MNDVASIKNSFADKSLFDLAMTHRSWINENAKARESNERLEFLGDAILEYIVSDRLYEQFPDREEGFMTTLRANLVNTVNLAGIAKKLNLGRELLLSKGEEETGGRDNPSLLADTVEALIGAIYKDKGLKAAKEFIDANLIPQIDEKLALPLKDAKSTLQEVVQAKGFPAPKYRIVSESGPDHAKEFEVEVLVDSKPQGQGQGKSKAEAEQDAAKIALANFGEKR